jgi:nitroimidazol reductase NimA-like FMN-containing flavoprotein (pyridoxamine 5'-phosphate oxidase superfamily)
MSTPQGQRPNMPDYGVETDDWEALPWSWAAERLLQNRNYWLVSASAAGRPHALPVWGVWNDGECRFAFSCGPRSRKAANIDANPQVTFATESTEECLSIEGTAGRVVDAGREAEWIDRYLVKYRPVSSELSADFLHQNLLFEVVPERALAVIERESEFATRATRWSFA